MDTQDLVSKQMAIDAAIEAVDSWDGRCSIGRQKRIENYIKKLPPAQPKRGKWNRLDMDTLNCNKCGATFILNQGSEKMYFCPNCGADMRGEQNDR